MCVYWFQGISLYESCQGLSSPQKRQRRVPLRLREDPQVCYTETLRQSVDNDIRYRQTAEQQQAYKRILGHPFSTYLTYSTMIFTLA